MYAKIIYVLMAGASVFCSGRAEAQTSSYGELQAAYMFNFAKYIKWPGEMEVFVIGVYGDSEIIEELQKTLKGKKTGGKEIELKVIESEEQLMRCQMIYLPESNSKKLIFLKTATAGKSILIVTEEDLTKKGAPISFVVEDDRLKFKLKKSALSEAGLIASEGILRLAILL